jgi:methionyl-tRNA formyltransferase
MPSSTRIVMLGTGDFALPTFLHLVDSGHNLEALVTQPDRPQGRKQELIPSLIKRAAIDRSIPVLQPENVNAAEAVAQIAALSPELLVTAAYGQILSAELLGVPRLGGINLHGSVLPAYRGAAPVARAIENGETESGVTVILMTPRIDAGGMLKVGRTPIEPNETAGELEARLARLGAPLVAEAIAELEAGKATILPQDRSRVTRAPKLTKEAGEIHWNRPARAIHDLVRAMQPWPTAFTSLNVRRGAAVEPLRVIVHQTEVLDEPANAPPGSIVEARGDRLIVAASEGLVRLKVLQVAGKKAMPAADFLRGHEVVQSG